VVVVVGVDDREEKQRRLVARLPACGRRPEMEAGPAAARDAKGV